MAVQPKTGGGTGSVKGLWARRVLRRRLIICDGMAVAHLGRGEPPSAAQMSVPQARLSPATQGRHGGSAAEGERFRSPRRVVHTAHLKPAE
jgi:hypothetical protein